MQSGLKFFGAAFSATLLTGLMAGSATWAADAPAPSARRYLNLVFAEHIRTGDVVFAENTNNLTGKLEKLTLRVFEPKGDKETKRPLLILTPGGGFVRTEDFWMDDFGEDLARAGYVVAINRYRLSSGINTPELYFDALFKAMSDQKAAVRYFVKDAAGANRYKIDTDNIFIGGHSAGGITSLHVAYLDASDTMPEVMAAAMKKHGGLDGNSGNEKIPFKVRGVINLSGLVSDLDMLDPNEAALMSLHGDKDDVVAIGATAAGTFGSIPIHRRAESVGIRNELHVIQGGEHNDTSDPQRCPECIPLIKRFMFNTMVRTVKTN
ncbi:MAG: alpha/beta hydrolase [Pseudomonadota bacterium]